MRGKEGAGDPEGREAKSGLASYRCRLNTSHEKALLLMQLCEPGRDGGNARNELPDIIHHSIESLQLFMVLWSCPALYGPDFLWCRVDALRILGLVAKKTVFFGLA